MAKLKGPFFSTWASGTFNKTITVRACFSNNKFVMAVKKRSAGKRHPIQIFNANVFKERIAAVKLSQEV